MRFRQLHVILFAITTGIIGVLIGFSLVISSDIAFLSGYCGTMEIAKNNKFLTGEEEKKLREALKLELASLSYGLPLYSNIDLESCDDSLLD